ncbi:MAG: hypothetical protein QN187_03175 [Armatimonadota bacterium]|nr:hypothetical protein [Armatimonadota bacterium]MDR7520820.1 hypothetical protein [Armatimonadota bacterium]MDR7551041.1 hypothetical protein [Armatimonadota bacterium]
MISHYAWPGGLALVIEAQDRRHAAVFGPQGWRAGDPRAVLPDGLPPGVEVERLGVPPWLAEQLPSLEMAQGGLHTDFVRLDRLLTRLEAEGARGVVLVLGRSPAVWVLADGRPSVVLAPDRAGDPAAALSSRASGWIVVLAGPVTMPVRPSAAPEAQAPEPAPPQPAAEPVAPAAAEVRFVAAPGTSQAMDGEAAALIRAAVGDAGLRVVGFLDGSRTAGEIAREVGLSSSQVVDVIRILADRKLAFRYVSRTRPPTGARSAG